MVRARVPHAWGAKPRKRAPPTLRPDVRKTWPDVAYPQVAGHLCAMMGVLGRTGGGRVGGWHRTGRRASRGRGGWAGPGARGGLTSPPDGHPVVPWEDLLALVEPLGTGAPRRGRQPWPAETLPQTHLARCRPDLTGVACEGACHGSPSVRDFVGCRYHVPDA